MKKVKRITRKHVDGWLLPIRSALKEIRRGEVDSIDGAAVTRLDSQDTYARIDHCLAGFTGMLRRVLPSFELTPLDVLQNKLSADEPLTVGEIDAAFATLNAVVKPLISSPWDSVKAAIQTEQIAIEFEQMGLANAAC